MSSNSNKQNPLAGIDSVSWGKLSHAYGDASDVPGHLRALVDGDAKAADHASSELFAAILHQGTIYTATIPAIPFFARIAACPGARGRKEALWFLVGFGESIRAGWSRTPGYLPRGTNMKDFDARCRAALAGACEMVASVVSDPAPELRALAAQVAQASLPMPGKIIAMLRRQLSVEKDNDAKAAIIRALVAGGALSRAEVDALREKSAPSVVFATAWKAVQSGAEIEPWHFETLAKHWGACAEKLEARGVCGDAIVELVMARKGAVLPLLDALAVQKSPAVQRSAIDGAAALAGISRASADAALDVLLKVARKPHADMRRRLVHMLGNTGVGGRAADAIIDVATGDPSPTWTQTVKRPTGSGLGEQSYLRDLRADGALALLRAGDKRWDRLLDEASPETDWVGHNAMCSTFAIAFAREKAPCTPRLLARAKKRIAVEPSSWCELLETWPVEKALTLAREVMAGLPKAVQKASLLLGSWRCAAAIPRLEELAQELDARGSNTAMWPHIALAQLKGDARHFELARAAYERSDKEGKAKYFLSDLLNAWSARPGAAFHALCRALITGKAATSFPAREEQLLAIRALAGVDGAKSVWPTLLAIIDKAERPLPNACALAVQLSKDAPKNLMDSLVAMLESIVAKGRSTWSGKDECAPVTAMGALLQLQPDHPKGLATNLTALKKATSEHRLLPLVPDICGMLKALAQQNPANRKKIAATITRLLKSDNRVVTISDEDCARMDDIFCRALADALHEISGTGLD
ncbi:hypothetical protein M2447_000069 [Ereboglobus sp. PH5-10]|uniref:hypothetical protein n=1 Tax=Ereboglobus sp. PH5-10 TaxID=2940629 RepID=UPI0024063B5B|nr:hypothetical protein [Ereboglobus sp. PH5-10]MDF9825993.1 hypothetical protein [Ereboglobus sp. PH5-10]